jgi:hypothetical protein
MSSLYQIFKREIPNILRSGSKSHREIAIQLKSQFPHICDDSIPCPQRQNGGQVFILDI